MKFAASVLVALLVHASAFAGARVVVPSLPEAATPDAEVETNDAVRHKRRRLGWNGGCTGRGNGGERYYSPDTTLRSVLHRLVMYGVDQEGAGQQDITIGNVRGVWYTESGGVREWELSDAPVGFFSNIYKKASPAHE